MNLRRALVRAARTLIQNLIPVTGAFFAALGAEQSFAGIKDHAEVLALGLFIAIGGAAVSFLMNLVEDSTNTAVISKE